MMILCSLSTPDLTLITAVRYVADTGFAHPHEWTIHDRLGLGARESGAEK